MDLDSAQNALVIILVTLVPTLVIPKALAAVEALTSLHARGRTRGEATTWECPNVKHGIVALSCAMAVLRVEVTNCQHQGQWSGIVDDVNAEARSYAIKYDDDHYESDVEAERVREDL